VSSEPVAARGAPPPASVAVDLEWLGGHRLRGRSGEVEMTTTSFEVVPTL